MSLRQIHSGRTSLQLLVFSLLFTALPLRAAEAVESLRYGASLFHFYQQDYFEALSELMVGQARETLGPHTEGAELLRGGMALSYGMDVQAEAIFNEQLASAPTSVDRSRAWFYLAKVAWQRGDTDRAMSALASMAPDYSGAVAHEASYLQASAQLSLGDESSALALLYDLPKTSKWRYYLHYNAAARRAAQGDWAQAQAHYERFESLELETPELQALYEKARTAAGYAFLAADEPALAGAAFETVSLDGAVAEKAMLGYGWAAVRTGDYAGALRAWSPLTSRSMLEPSARESLMAVPYAYEQLGRAGIALAQYEAASAVYSEQLDGLERAVEAFRVEPVSVLLGVGAAQESPENVMSWLFAGDILPEGEFAHYLQYLVTRHGFQVALRELRDLHDMRRRLYGAKERLTVLREVDLHQREVWADVVGQSQLQGLAQNAAVLAAQHARLQQRLQQVLEQQDGRALGDVADRARWQRLERALANAEALGREEQREKLLFLRGVMSWNDSEAFVARRWEARKAMAELEELQRETERGLAQVQAALQERRSDNFLPRIDALEQRVEEHLASVAQALTRSESDVRQQAVAALEEQAQQMRRALGQSGLAIARLYDSGARGGSTP